MSVLSISPFAFQRELEWFIEITGEHVDYLSWTIASHHATIPQIPKRVGTLTLPFFFGIELKLLFDFARGDKQATTDHIRDVVDKTLELLFASPASRSAGIRAEVDWDFLMERPLGTVLRAALARAQLNDGEWLDLDEMRALTGLTSSRIDRLGIETKTLSGRVRCEPEAVAEVVARLEKDAATI